MNYGTVITILDANTDYKGIQQLNIFQIVSFG